jgi:hypothetical protein
VRDQAFELTGGKLKIRNGQRVRRCCDTSEQPITPRLTRWLALRDEKIVQARGEHRANPQERCKVRLPLSRRIIAISLNPARRATAASERPSSRARSRIRWAKACIRTFRRRRQPCDEIVAVYDARLLELGRVQGLFSQLPRYSAPLPRTIKTATAGARGRAAGGPPSRRLALWRPRAGSPSGCRASSDRAVLSTGVAASGFGDEANLTPKTAAYFVLNLHTSYQLTTNLQLFGLIENAFNTTYYTFGTFSPTSSVPIVQVPGATNQPCRTDCRHHRHPSDVLINDVAEPPHAD